MPKRSWSKTYRRADGVLVNLAEEQLSWQNSPRGPDRKLKLRTNTLYQHKSFVVEARVSGDAPYRPSSDSAKHWYFSEWRKAKEMAYSRLRGKLYKGNAALGVTFASLQQSRDMIAHRSNLVASAAEELSSLSRHKRWTKRLASIHLETIFGWQPLLSDIYNATTSVIQKADSVEFVRGAGEAAIDRHENGRDDNFLTAYQHYTGKYRVSMGGQVRITNPNKWLLERAGLANPVAVAWDIVPFSFIVNMFTNVGSLVNRVSDFYGLEFHETFTAYRLDLDIVKSVVHRYPFEGSEFYRIAVIDKYREAGLSAPPISLSFRTPELSWSTAAMAASLMVQQAVPMIRLGARLKERFF